MKKWLYFNIVCRLIDRKICIYTDGLTECFINKVKNYELFLACMEVSGSVIYDDYSLRSQYKAYRTISDFIKTH